MHIQSFYFGSSKCCCCRCFCRLLFGLMCIWVAVIVAASTPDIDAHTPLTLYASVSFIYKFRVKTAMRMDQRKKNPKLKEKQNKRKKKQEPKSKFTLKRMWIMRSTLKSLRETRCTFFTPYIRHNAATTTKKPKICVAEAEYIRCMKGNNWFKVMGISNTFWCRIALVLWNFTMHIRWCAALTVSFFCFSSLFSFIIFHHFFRFAAAATAAPQKDSLINKASKDLWKKNWTAIFILVFLKLFTVNCNNSVTKRVK